MNHLSLHISYLLGHHDCVVVPGLGAFINNYKSAWIDETTMEFHGPSVSVVFNPELDYNDWMIADSISRRESISREAALKILNDEVKALRFQLETDREVSLGELGSLRFNGGATPEYEPATAISSLSVFAGLPVLNRNEAAELPAQQEVVAGPADNHAVFPGGGFWRVAACIIAIFMAATFLFRPDGNRADSEIHFAGIESGLSAYTLVDILRGENPSDVPALYIAMPAERNVSEKPVSAPDNSGTEALRLDSNDRYYVIVASFETAAQARNFITLHTDNELRVFNADDNYRVYAATSPTLAGAMEIVDTPSFKAAFSQAWILKK